MTPIFTGSGGTRTFMPTYRNAYTVGEQFPRIPLSAAPPPTTENFIFWCISDNLFDIMIMDG